MSTVLLFKKKKNTYLSVLIISMILFLLNFSLWYDKQLGLAFLIVGTVLLALFINIYGFYKWRCPNCKTFLGSTLHHDSCPKCNCNFTDTQKYGIEHTYLNENRNGEYLSSINDKIQIPESLREFEKMNIYNWNSKIRIAFIFAALGTVSYSVDFSNSTFISLFISLKS